MIAGVWIVEPAIHGDQRGLFIETYRREWFPNGREMIQGNRANRQQGAVVGLHYHLHQADYWYVPFGHARVVLHDLREGGPTDGATLELDLTGDNHIGVFIPPGVAHGFAALTDMVITYLVDGYYNPADELGVLWNDPAIGADWGVTDPILSDRDQANPLRADLPAGRRPYWPDANVSMKLFVTGAAGFIGSNYVRHLLANTDDEVTVFDALTYAGNLDEHPRRLDDRRCRFVHGDICDQDDVLDAMDGHDAVVHFAAETHVDRSIKDGYSFVRTNCFGTNVLCDVARQVGVERFLHISTDEVYGSIEEGSFSETIALGAALAVLGGQGRQRPDRAQLLHDPRPAGAGHAVQQQLRAVPVPREGHPAVHHQPARRPEGAAVRRRRQRPRLDPRARPQHRGRSRAAHGHGRRDLQHRRRQRDHQQRAHPPAARADRSRRELHHAGRRPARATTAATRSPTTRSPRSAGSPSTT